MTDHGWVQVGTHSYPNSYVQPGKMITINYDTRLDIEAIEARHALTAMTGMHLTGKEAWEFNTTLTERNLLLAEVKRLQHAIADTND